LFRGIRRLSAVRPALDLVASDFFLPYLTLGLVFSVLASKGFACGNGSGAGGAGGVGGGGAAGSIFGGFGLLPKIHISFYQVG